VTIKSLVQPSLPAGTDWNDWKVTHVKGNNTSRQSTLRPGARDKRHDTQRRESCAGPQTAPCLTLTSDYTNVHGHTPSGMRRTQKLRCTPAGQPESSRPANMGQGEGYEHLGLEKLYLHVSPQEEEVELPGNGTF
jgi:hypothetical protein